MKKRRKRKDGHLLMASISVDHGMVDGSFLWCVGYAETSPTAAIRLIRCPLVPDGCQFDGFLTDGGLPEVEAFGNRYSHQLDFAIASCECDDCMRNSGILD